MGKGKGTTRIWHTPNWWSGASGIGAHFIRAACKSTELKSYQPTGRTYYITPEDFWAWAEKSRVKPEADDPARRVAERIRREGAL
jgi:hypothetical protein